MAPREAKGLLSRVFGSRAKDPLWDGFINRPLSDPKNDLAGAIRAAPEGAVYPVKTEVSDPAAMSLDIKELGRWFGVDVVGIARLEASHVHPDQLRDGAEPRPAEDVARDYPYAIVCGVVTDYDPESTQGMAGRVAVLEGTIASFHLGAYIRELGYRASIGGADPVKVAEAAGLGRLEASGRFAAPGQKGYLHVSDPILTELPLAVDTQHE